MFAQERYRNKSRSAESVGSQYHYELPFVHIEPAQPEAYTHTNGDEDTIDSESEDIRRDLTGTPTNSHHSSSHSTSDHLMTSFYPQKDHQQWSDYDSDNNNDETNSDIVYSNKTPLNELNNEGLTPILSLGDYEDDDNIVIANPSIPTFYSESNCIPNSKASPRRSAATKGGINLEALTTLESSGEYHVPKQSTPNYQRKYTSRSAVDRNHKALRKAKSEINLEEATKIVGATAKYHKHHSRIDLQEATKLAHSDVRRANTSPQHRKPHHSSSSRLLDSSSRLERLTSLDT